MKTMHALAVAAGALTLVGASAATAYATVPATLTSLEPVGGAANDPDITFTSPGSTVECDTALGLATLADSPSTHPPSGTLTNGWFQGCIEPTLQIPFTVTALGPATFVVTGGGPSVWTGELTNLAHHFDAPDTGCEFDVTGSLDTTYTLSTHTLAITGSDLTVSNVTGCFGTVLDGDPVGVAASFDVS